jgi:putative spermidine/putrescine transport system permease protein
MPGARTAQATRLSRFWSWLFVGLGALYFVIPLIGMFEFSLRAKRGVYSFKAYQSVVNDSQFWSTFSYSLVLSLVTIAVGILLVVPTVFWVRLRLPQMRDTLEFLTLLPLVIPTIVVAFGYIRLYNTSSFLPLTNSALGTDILLSCGYVALSLPYLYRAIDTGLRAIDIHTLTEAAQSLGAGWLAIFGRVILPNIFVAVLSGAFLTFAIVVGEYVIASILDRPAFAVYMVWTGRNRAYEPSALAVIAFGITWACIVIIQVLSSYLARKRAGG